MQLSDKLKAIDLMMVALFLPNPNSVVHQSYYSEPNCAVREFEI